MQLDLPLIIQIAFSGLLVLIALATVAPLSRIRHGILQGLDFPRQQYMFTAAAMGLAAPFLLDGRALDLVFLLALATAIINGIFVAKFTPLWRRQVRRADASLRADTDRHLSVVIANVKMSNRDYAPLNALVRDAHPDVFIALETDARWIDGLAPVRDLFDTHIDVPHDTGYGMLLWSRLPLHDTIVEEVITEGVPSIVTTIELRSGQHVRLWSLHPEPPVPDQHTTGRDSEIAHAGLAARDQPLPAIVTGDLNDVAWSSTTRQFQRLSGMADPRVGRGFFNTFNAFYPVFRWPLDHVFHDPEFRLIELRRGPKIGSDHFPILFTLALADDDAGHMPEPAEPGEEDEVRDMIAREAATPRPAIGSDWEADEEKARDGG